MALCSLPAELKIQIFNELTPSAVVQLRSTNKHLAYLVALESPRLYRKFAPEYTNEAVLFLDPSNPVADHKDPSAFYRAHQHLCQRVNHHLLLTTDAPAIKKAILSCIRRLALGRVQPGTLEHLHFLESFVQPLVQKQVAQFKEHHCSSRDEGCRLCGIRKKDAYMDVVEARLSDEDIATAVLECVQSLWNECHPVVLFGEFAEQYSDVLGM